MQCVTGNFLQRWFPLGPERERQLLADVRLVPRLPPRRLLLLLLLPHAGQRYGHVSEIISAWMVQNAGSRLREPRPGFLWPRGRVHAT